MKRRSQGPLQKQSSEISQLCPLELAIMNLQEQRGRIRTRIGNIKHDMHNYPSGKLMIRRKNNRLHFYQIKGQEERSLKQTGNTSLFLARKIFLEKDVEKLERLCDGIDVLLSDCIAKPLLAQEQTRESRILEKFPQCKRPLLKSEVEWAQAKYRSNSMRPEGLIYLSTCGIKVRSKSELVIINFLTAIGAIFRYEPELIIDGNFYYPDFIILLSDGSVLIWEHLGLAGNDNYDTSFLRKLNAYRQIGFCTNKNLILTYEDDVHSEDNLLQILCRYYH